MRKFFDHSRSFSLTQQLNVNIVHLLPSYYLTNIYQYVISASWLYPANEEGLFKAPYDLLLLFIRNIAYSSIPTFKLKICIWQLYFSSWLQKGNLTIFLILSPVKQNHYLNNALNNDAEHSSDSMLLAPCFPAVERPFFPTSENIRL